MRLELGEFPVDAVVPGTETSYSSGTLTVDLGELRSLLLEDARFADVELTVAHPGESLRVTQVIDCVEPRVRTSGDTNFPGMVGPPWTVGQGRTHCLKGVAVTEASPPVPGEPTYWREALFDLGGAGSRYSPMADVAHLVLHFQPSETAGGANAPSKVENVFEGTPAAIAYNRALRVAGLKAAVYLADSVKDLAPERLVVREPAPATRDLPRVVYAFQLSRSYVYGEAVTIGGPGSLPTIIHPNEILDGAVVNRSTLIAGIRDVTYLLQNHPVVTELYRRDGQDLAFGGVVIYTQGDDTRSKERMSKYVAQLVAECLHADAAVLTSLGAGHPTIDCMLVCQELERRQVATSLIMPEIAQDPGDSGFVEFVPEADSIVSTGNQEEMVTLPAVEQVIGGDTLLGHDAPSGGEITIPVRYILAATSNVGGHVIRGVER